MSPRPIRWMVVLLMAASLSWPIAYAHFPILTTDANEAKKGQLVSATIRYGHPFENEFEDCVQPDQVVLIHPDGKSTTVTPRKSEFELAGKKYAEWKIEFTPESRGDYLIRATWKPKTAPKEEPTVQEIAETWVHVQQEKGWDKPMEGWTCLHRPYGILPGMVFRAKLGSNSGFLADTPFEYEYLNLAPPAAMPKSTLVTFTGKTDQQGSLAISFPKSGWWAISAEVAPKKLETSPGAAKEPTKRHVLWVFVDRAE